ncbi:Leucine-rich repeat extensin protein 4 [Spatholobus suberectus]|nr:Leucine-rich repeat extensin protein 4 [Spatholobus suberectus]
MRNWVGPNVCNYTYIFYALAPDNLKIHTIVRIDLHHSNIVKYLLEELGLLTDLALFHINTNYFCSTVPHKFDHLKLLFKLDLNNNIFPKKFLNVVLQLLQLKFLTLSGVLASHGVQ